MVSLFVILQNSLTQKQLGDGINHFAHGGVPLIICVCKKKKKLEKPSEMRIRRNKLTLFDPNLLNFNLVSQCFNHSVINWLPT